ncbi:ISL3 family transposase [Sphaerisporangium sp. NPDC051011]|uniref:ISL3 family transposase n=1 Tax=Sphaerisporangium sp. NPDC051011 TaxID=3155792 RepID=UPI0033D7C9DF
MPEITVVDVERVADDDGKTGRLVHIERPEEWAACPECGVISTSVRQRRTTRPRDLPYGEEPIEVRWHKRQFSCTEQLCPRKAFTESTAEIPPRARTTGRLCRAAAAQVASGRSVAAVGRQYRLSWPLVHRHFAIHADAVLLEPEPPQVLGIDETRRGKPKWFKDPATATWSRSEPFETNFVDLSGSGGLLGQAAGRTGAAVVEWLQARGPQWTAAVQVVAIDPAACYRTAIKHALPHATIVVDHFHLVALANKALTAVRQRVTREERGRRGRSTDPEWANRRRLLRAREHLSQRSFTTMWNALIDHEPSGQILTAWIAKEELRTLLACARTQAPRSVISHRLARFFSWCADSGIPELITLAQTIDAWWPETLAFITSGITNARTEGTNRLIKDAARVAFGFRNLNNQRRRVRLACTHHMINPAA